MHYSVLGRGGGPIKPFNEHDNLHFEIEQDIHVCFENYEESGYILDLDVLTILY